MQYKYRMIGEMTRDGPEPKLPIRSLLNFEIVQNLNPIMDKVYIVDKLP